MLSTILYYFYASLIYGEYLANNYFSDIPHTFNPHFTLHSAEKIRIKFSANYPSTTFHILQKYPFPFCGLLHSPADSCGRLRPPGVACLLQSTGLLRWSCGRGERRGRWSTMVRPHCSRATAANLLIDVIDGTYLYQLELV